jgi:ABC-2 type transport system ATP-binding protein
MQLVKVSNLSKSYKSKLVVNNLSFTLENGQVLGLLGHNGAGKSSLINALLGFKSYQGNISICGLNPINQHVELMSCLGYISDGDVLPKWMTVKQILRYVSGMQPNFDFEKALGLLSNTDIQQNSKIKTLSKGMKVQLHLALTIASDAKVMILDEPTLGLDLIYRETFYRQLIEWLHDGERSLIIASHEVNEIEHLLTDVLMLKQGNSIAQGPIEEVLLQYINLEANHSYTESIQTLEPISSQPGLGTNKWIIRAEFLDQATKYGEVSNLTLQDLFIALQKESD